MEKTVDVKKFKAKGKLRVVEGTILTPEHAGLRLVINLIDTNGFSTKEILPIFEKRWKKIKEEAKGWYASRNNFKLGEIATIAVQSDVWVINCLCQNSDSVLDQKQLESCFKKIVSIAKNEKASIHLSKILIDTYQDLVPLLNNYFIDDGINVSIYQE